MKLLHVIETLGRGGAEQVLVSLLPELKRAGDTVSVAVLRQPMSLRDALREAGVDVYQLPAHNKWNMWRGARNLAALARSLDCDIVHSHLYFPTVYTSLARRWLPERTKTCATFHNLAYVPGVNRAGAGLWLRRNLARRVVPSGIDGPIAVSQSVADHYQEALGLGDMTVLHNPVDVQMIAGVAQTLGAGVAGGGPVHIVVPGRLVHEKGHLDFFDAVTTLVSQGLDMRITVAGGGPLQGMLEAHLDSTGLASLVQMTGALSHEDLLRIVAQADIVVIPSRFEGFGLAALEAMALGKPVVATRAGGLVEVVVDGETGCLVAPGQPSELAVAIRQLAQAPELRVKLGQAGQRRAHDRFSLSRIAKDLRAHYDAQLTDTNRDNSAPSQTDKRYG